LPDNRHDNDKLEIRELRILPDLNDQPGFSPSTRIGPPQILAFWFVLGRDLVEEDPINERKKNDLLV
jgi:hypothetical protein